MCPSVRLRGRHILCLVGLHGLGGGDAVAENLTGLYSRVFDDKHAIELVEVADDICTACPNNVQGECGASEPSTRQGKDVAVLVLLSLQPGDRIEASELYRRVADRVTEAELSRLCSGCESWKLGHCAESIGRLSFLRTAKR